MKPSEAVAKGRMLEVGHREKIEAVRSVLALASGKKRQGIIYTHDSVPAGKTNEVVGKLVGMTSAMYYCAKAVVAMAEKNPALFGDLISKMDETGNVGGIYREMRRRQRGGGRNQALSKLRHLKPSREVQRAVHSMEGICDCLRQIDVQKLDGSNREEWARSLFASATTIRNFARRIANGKSNLQVRPDRIHLWDGSDR